MEDIQSTNINIKWLENIYEQLKTLQDLERMAREGCRTLGEYLQIPLDLQKIIIPETQYKNLRFMALEIEMLLKNIVPILEGGIDKYETRLNLVLNSIDKKELFLKNVKENNSPCIEVLPLLYKAVEILLNIKGDIIKDLSPVLYIKDKGKSGW
jgi:hypothetical protein